MTPEQLFEQFAKFKYFTPHGRLDAKIGFLAGLAAGQEMEREECGEICEEYFDANVGSGVAMSIADAIRARGER